MALNLASLPLRLALAALLAASLIFMLVQAWATLSRVEESLVTDRWEAPRVASAVVAPAP